ncbi:hypothetical protein A9G30_01835 [Gilliamella sp. Fer4-1]|nr:hypothetical protein A9G30_01835 [Gilliamella apicola]
MISEVLLYWFVFGFLNALTLELIATFPELFAVCIGKAVLVGVEAADILFLIAVCAYTCQWLVVALVGVDIQATVPIRAGFLYLLLSYPIGTGTVVRFACAPD